MNEIVNKFLLVGDKFMLEMHLRQPRFTYFACGPFTKIKERIQKFKETGGSRYIYQNELDKACFQHGMAYGGFKYLTRRTASDKILRDLKFNIAKNPKYDEYQKVIASMVYKLFDKKTVDGAVKNEIIQNKELVEELHKAIVTNCLEKRKVNSSFIDNIWGADLADMQLLSKFNKEICILLCVIDIYSKYARVISLKDKKGIPIINAFQQILDELRRKPNKIWIDKGSYFYNGSMKSWLEKNDTETYSTYNDGKSVVSERFIRTLKSKIYKYMTPISKNMYINKLDDIVNKYNNTYYSTIK